MRDVLYIVTTNQIVNDSREVRGLGVFGSDKRTASQRVDHVIYQFNKLNPDPCLRFTPSVTPLSRASGVLIEESWKAHRAAIVKSSGLRVGGRVNRHLRSAVEGSRVIERATNGSIWCWILDLLEWWEVPDNRDPVYSCIRFGREVPSMREIQRCLIGRFEAEEMMR